MIKKKKKSILINYEILFERVSKTIFYMMKINEIIRIILISLRICQKVDVILYFVFTLCTQFSK